MSDPPFRKLDVYLFRSAGKLRALNKASNRQNSHVETLNETPYSKCLS